MQNSDDQQVPWVATSHGHGSLDLHATLGYDNSFAQHVESNDVTDDHQQVEQVQLSRISLRENGVSSPVHHPNGLIEEDNKPVAAIAPMMSLSSQNHVQPMIESVR